MWPRPRPEIIGTKPPQAATIGASIRDTLSPTPPVECLSSTGPGRARPDQSITVPDWVMARVRVIRSDMPMPWKKTAMAKAAIWPSPILPSVRPWTMKAISASVRVSPSRLRRMISWGSRFMPRTPINCTPTGRPSTGAVLFPWPGRHWPWSARGSRGYRSTPPPGW